MGKITIKKREYDFEKRNDRSLQASLDHYNDVKEGLRKKVKKNLIMSILSFTIIFVMVILLAQTTLVSILVIILGILGIKAHSTSFITDFAHYIMKSYNYKEYNLLPKRIKRNIDKVIVSMSTKKARKNKISEKDLIFFPYDHFSAHQALEYLQCKKRVLEEHKIPDTEKPCDFSILLNQVPITIKNYPDLINEMYNRLALKYQQLEDARISAITSAFKHQIMPLIFKRETSLEALKQRRETLLNFKKELPVYLNKKSQSRIRSR